MKSTTKLVTGGVATATLALTLAVAPTATAAAPTDTSRLRQAVTAQGVMQHLQALQGIADANDGTRVSGSAGHTQSADYVAGLLEDAGYQVTRQEFEFPFFAETAPPVFERTSPDARTYAEGTDFATMEYSGSGDVTAAVHNVDLVLPPGADANTSTSGCEASDFTGFPAGGVALIQRGTCTFGQKAQNAEAAGASAVVIFNEGQDGRTELLSGTLGGPGVTIPVLGTTFDVGQELASISGATVHIATQTESSTRTTENVIADTPTGRPDRTVVVGAHLDSVPKGPGINDNGSGSATILEIALQMARLGIEPVNRTRFAFWGAEESGLLGSEHYVSSLSQKQLKQIMLNLNFDMVGSPNYVRFVYDGDGSDTDLSGPQGSNKIEQVFTDYFASQGLASDPTAFDGRSDYGPFIEAGIPAGGLFTGAEGVKTPEQAEVYGGEAGTAYDACYHQACDTLKNVNLKALDEMSDAAAHATLTYAMASSAVSSSEHSPDKAAESMEYSGSHARR